MTDYTKQVREYIGQRKIISPFHLQNLDWVRASGKFEDHYISIPAVETPRYTGFSQAFERLWMGCAFNFAVILSNVDGTNHFFLALDDQLRAMTGEPDASMELKGENKYPVWVDNESFREDLPTEWVHRLDDLLAEDVQRPTDNVGGKERLFRSQERFDKLNFSIL